jgi:hypothetical protein
MLSVALIPSIMFSASQTASATWAMTTNAVSVPTTAGSLTATNEAFSGIQLNTGWISTVSSLTAAYLCPANGWLANQSAPSDTTYVEFTVTPTAGHIFNISSLAVNLWADNITDSTVPNMFATIRYSINGFTSSTEILSGKSLSTTVAYAFSSTAGIRVPSGQTLSIRIYPYNNQPISATYQCFNLNNLVVSGTTDTDAVTPVQLTSFTSASSGLNATLSWNTATETNNAGFYVERKSVNSQSSTANSWSEVAFVAGNGTSATAHSYSYTDASASAGTYDYRLKQIDNDGSISYSQESEVTVGSASKALSLSNYPNPFNPSTSILFSVPSDGNTVVKIYNVVGQEVATAFVGAATAGRYYKASFDGSHLASGVYYYSVQNNGQQMVKKMLMVK